jgi:hypothetical protein
LLAFSAVRRLPRFRPILGSPPIFSEILVATPPGLCIAAIHADNTSPKRPDGAFWEPLDQTVLTAMRARAAHAH